MVPSFFKKSTVWEFLQFVSSILVCHNSSNVLRLESRIAFSTRVLEEDLRLCYFVDLI